MAVLILRAKIISHISASLLTSHLCPKASLWAEQLTSMGRPFEVVAIFVMPDVRRINEKESFRVIIELLEAITGEIQNKRSLSVPWSKIRLAAVWRQLIGRPG